MDAHMLNTIANFIWGIADDCLRDVYVRGKYRDVILPMTVIRRLDAVLEDTKPQVLEMKKTLDTAGITNQWGALCNVAGQAFCNASPFCLRDLTSRPNRRAPGGGLRRSIGLPSASMRTGGGTPCEWR